MFNYMKARLDYVIGTIASVAFILAGYYNLVSFQDIEILGFVTGAWSVWLLAKDNIWNWAWGIVNGAIYVYIFWQYNLFADATINMWYVVAGIAGFVYWKWGGKNKTEKLIQHITPLEILASAAAIILITYGMYGHLVHLGDTAPFLDALTTAMSIVAFYLQARKIIENWYLWILADCIYIPLYFVKALPLTGVLYMLFMAMCFVGLVQWFKTYRKQHPKPLNRRVHLSALKKELDGSYSYTVRGK